MGGSQVRHTGGSKAQKIETRPLYPFSSWELQSQAGVRSVITTGARSRGWKTDIDSYEGSLAKAMLELGSWGGTLVTPETLNGQRTLQST